ncbi:transcriptional regulator [Pleomorphovibrio marinus]|uniref:transcriptional regulator n=1 Tax=Pleomorphovibrio marinus TaxID=2164132 RepID=UPI000E0AB64F|nr:transcriptional regulator [Pleomorphovibrio marinus]
MIAVLTGDLVNSQDESPEIWMPPLKQLLANWGHSPQGWEVYRGDSFQLRLEDPANSLKAAIFIKSRIKMMSPLDVRMAIGIGEMTFDAGKITESNGSAFVHSGETFESLKKRKQDLAFKSPWKELDQMVNIELKLALTIMDGWTANAAEAVFHTLDTPELSQQEQGAKLGITQHAFSTRLKRAHFEVIRQWMEYVSHKIESNL